MNAEIGPAPRPWKENQKHPGKKRLRRSENWARSRAKKARNEGKMYTDRKGTVHQARNLQQYNHNCRYGCNANILEDKRQSIFNSFWKLGTWDLQTSFLCSSIILEEPVRKKHNASYVKRTSCTYTLEGFRVCKEFFLKTLDVSNKRVTNVINKKMSSENTVAHKDKRGHKVPSNKTSDQATEKVKEHINSLPKYSSHYSRVRSPNMKYLSTDLSIKKLYTLYVEMCKEQNISPVKESLYRYIFQTQFNLSIKRPQTDTCDKCDTLQNKIDNGTDEETVENAKTQKELHLRKAELAKTVKDNDRNKFKDDPTTAVVCFDLQKTLATPSLTCKKAYYSRQLWTYNFCVHNVCTGLAHMFMWHEGQGNRGCKEIASCLFKFIKTLPQSVKHLILYSDNCGGQNKSHYIAKFWHYVVRKTQIETIDQKFLVVGHSFMECDQDFGIIEKAKKKNNQQIYVPSMWADIILKSSRKFTVTQMEDDDIMALEQLDPFFRKNVPGISKMQWLHFEKNHPFTLFYKESFNMPTFLELNMRPSKSGRPLLELPLLAPIAEKPKIKKVKFDNLQSLLPYVPPVHHGFFNSLQYENRANRVPPEVDQNACQQHEEAGQQNIFDSDSDDSM